MIYKKRREKHVFQIVRDTFVFAFAAFQNMNCSRFEEAVFKSSILYWTS